MRLHPLSYRGPTVSLLVFSWDCPSNMRSTSSNCLPFPWSPAKQEPKPELASSFPVQEKDLLGVGKLFPTFLLPLCFSQLTPFLLPQVSSSPGHRCREMRKPTLALFFSHILKYSLGYFANILNFLLRGIFIHSYLTPTRWLAKSPLHTQSWLTVI